MRTTHYQEIEGFKNPHSIRKAAKLQDSPHVNIIHMELAPGDNVIEHTTPVDVSFFVIEGSVRMRIGEEEQDTREGTLVESPANITHSFYNPTDRDARVLVIKHMTSEGEKTTRTQEE